MIVTMMKVVVVVVKEVKLVAADLTRKNYVLVGQIIGYSKKKTNNS